MHVTLAQQHHGGWGAGGADTLMSPWKLLAVVQGQVDTHDHVAAGVSACEPGLGGV